MSDPTKFLHALTHLNLAPTKFGKAPHKPVLLITLLELMESGYAIENRLVTQKAFAVFKISTMDFPFFFRDRE